MVNKILLIISLISVFIFIGINGLECPTGDNCPGKYCYYVNYTTYLNGSYQNNSVYEGCTNDFKLEIPPGSNTFWTFPVNHCQHFQTNQTGSKYEYFYGNVCDTRDNCTYKADSSDLVCAGYQTSPTLVILLLTAISGIFIAKIFV